MFKIAICDDDINFSNELEALILHVAEKAHMDIDTEVYADGDELLKDYYNKVRYSIIFLDIEMERMDGKVTAAKIREIDKNVLIFFVSNYEKHCKDLFIFEPVRYMSKPLGFEEFHLRFLEACARVNYFGHTFKYLYNKKTYEIPLNDIYYFESINRQIYIHFVKTDDYDRSENALDIQQYFYTTYKNLDRIDEELKRSSYCFIRINRSYLVNYDHICEITPDKIFLKNAAGASLVFNIAKNRQDKIRKQLAIINSESGK